jgi:hypothetical protein
MIAFAVTCPWCRSQFQRPSFSNCRNCGGSLPVSDGSGAGTAPPPAPRVLSKQFVRGVKYFNNVNTMIGMVFTIPFFWSVIFPVIGIFLWRKGIREARGELLPLENGLPALGEITAVQIDSSKSMNGRNPRYVQFVFSVNGHPYAGDVPNIMDPVELWKKPGDKIWVVYMPDNPEISSVWPPMK